MFDKPKLQLESDGEERERYDNFAIERQRLLGIIESQQSVIQQQLQVISNFQKLSSNSIQYLNNSDVDTYESNKKKRKLVVLNASQTSIKEPPNMVINNHSYVSPETEFVYPTKNSLSKPIKVCLKRKETPRNSLENISEKILKNPCISRTLTNNLNESEDNANNDDETNIRINFNFIKSYFIYFLNKFLWLKKKKKYFIIFQKKLIMINK